MNLVNTKFGQRLALTIRTSSTTLTVLLRPDDAKTWARLLGERAAGMSSLIVAGPGQGSFGLPGANGHAK